MKAVWITILFLILVSVTAFAQLRGKVVGISDGDTFTLLTKDSQRIRIRLYGIDCPESGQDYGQVAKRFTSDLLYKKDVYVKKMDTDRYGRSVGIVYVLPDSISVNEALLNAGLAWHYLRYDKNVKWSDLESKAKAGKKGLWAKNGAIAPWNYRKQYRKIHY